MSRIIVVCLQIALITITCSELSKKSSMLKNKTDQPWYHSQHSNILRQGIDTDAANPDLTEPSPPKRDCVCSRIYDPVCASNNESYFNLCLLECRVTKDKNVTVVHQGNCIPF